MADAVETINVLNFALNAIQERQQTVHREQHVANVREHAGASRRTLSTSRTPSGERDCRAARW